MPTSWQELAAEKKARQTASIPKEWLITPPADDVLDVTDVPAKCGVLSERDLEITAISDVTVLLQKLATGEWSSVEVTTAFCKRAVIAHQVVRPLFHLPANRQSYPHTLRLFFPDKLPYRGLHRPRPREGCLARRTTKVDWESRWAPSWSSNLAQGPNMYQRT